MQAKEWMREFGGATRGARGHKGHKVKMSVLQETEAREVTRPPRPVGPGRPTSPYLSAPGAPLRQVSNPSSSLFVCSNL
jgi:hypothetical protein